MFANFFKSKSAEQPSSKVVLVGAGEVGFQLAHRLAQEGREVVVIDINHERLARLTGSADVQVIEGSGSSPSILKQAGVESASHFLAVTNNDEINLAACLFANALAPTAVKLARIRNIEYGQFPQALGSDGLGIRMMVNPDEEVVHTIGRLLSLPGALDYAQFAEGRLRMVAYKMDHADFVGKPLTRFRELVGDPGIMVSAILRNEVLIIPGGSDVIQPGDIVYFVYRDNAQAALLRALGRSRSVSKTACIIGGGNIGLLLAKFFEAKGMDVKLIERDADRCQVLADQLERTLILRGDGTDKNLLEEERIGSMDVVAAVTGDDETNILSCLLSKSLGVTNTVASVNKAAYLPLMELIGIEHSVSSRQAAVNSFLTYLRKGKVLASASVAGDAADVLEAQLADDSPLVGKPVRELSLPHNALLLAVLRHREPEKAPDNVLPSQTQSLAPSVEEEDAFIPDGNTRLRALDHIVLLGSRAAIAKLEPLLGDSQR